MSDGSSRTCLPSEASLPVLERTPLAAVNIARQLYNHLSRSRVQSLAHVLPLLSADAGPGLELSPYWRAALHRHINAVLASITDGGFVDWVGYAKLLQIPVLPSADYAGQTPQHHFDVLPRVMQEILKKDERRWLVMQRRYGLDGEKRLAGQELATAFGVSRQRIDQIKGIALRTLKTVLIKADYAGYRFRVDPRIAEVARDALAFVQRHSRDGIREAELLARVEREFGIGGHRAVPTLALLAELGRIDIIEPRLGALDRVWKSRGGVSSARLESALQRVHQLLSMNSATPMRDIDILVSLNRNTPPTARFSLRELRGTLTLCSTIETRPDGSFWSKFERLRTDALRAERLLYEGGKPSGIRCLAREINRRMAGSRVRPTSQRYLSNRLTANGHLVPVGRSGWGLRSWSSLETSSILDLMEQLLSARGSAATPDEMYELISQRRRLSRQSITMYLGMRHQTFVEVAPGKWGLTSWETTHSEPIWDRVAVAKFVEDVFRRQGVSRLEFTTLRRALVAAAGVSARRAQGMLSSNPAVLVERPTPRERIAVLRPDREKWFAGPHRRTSTRPTQLALAEPVILAAMERSPDGVVTLRDMAELLISTLKLTYPNTAYGLISRLDSIEKFEDATSGVAKCRLRGAAPTAQVSATARSTLDSLIIKLKREEEHLDVEAKESFFANIKHRDAGPCSPRLNDENTLRDMLKTLVAFANTLGGDLVVGLENTTWQKAGIDDTDLVLCKDWDEFKRRFSRLVRDETKGIVPAPEIRREMDSDRTFAIVSVQQLPESCFRNRSLAYMKHNNRHYTRTNGDSIALELSDIATHCDAMLKRVRGG